MIVSAFAGGFFVLGDEFGEALEDPAGGSFGEGGVVGEGDGGVGNLGLWCQLYREG